MSGVPSDPFDTDAENANRDGDEPADTDTPTVITGNDPPADPAAELTHTSDDKEHAHPDPDADTTEYGHW